MTEQTSYEQTAQDEQLKEEGQSLVFAVISLLIIALIGAPCCCYFGLGLFQGVSSLQTGQYTNPARPTRRRMLKMHPARREHQRKQQRERQRSGRQPASPRPTTLP